MGDRLARKVATITGSTGGLGEGIARAMADEGASVVVSGRRTEKGEAVAHSIRERGGQAVFVRADVAIEADCLHLIRATLERFGRLDILVNNAAIFPRIPLDEQTAETWDREFAVNVRGAFLCSKEAIPAMRQQGGGAIINIGSTAVYRGDGEALQRLAYASSKGALLTMTKTMARALAGDHIRVNWVAVGWLATEGEIALRDGMQGDDGRAFLKARAKEMPMGRLETVEETAAGVVYLASDEAAHVTGCELNMSGGFWI